MSGDFDWIPLCHILRKLHQYDGGAIAIKTVIGRTLPLLSAKIVTGTIEPDRRRSLVRRRFNWLGERQRSG
jgi:hypothetical protein